MHSSSFSKPGAYITHNATSPLSEITEANIRFHATSWSHNRSVRLREMSRPYQAYPMSFNLNPHSTTDY